jgi:8-oxo-dGDP phosphatase
MAFEVEETEVTHDGQLSRIRVDTVRMPDGETADREIVEHPDAVAVVAILDDGSVVMLRQYRHPVGASLLEIPAGKLDVEGEDPTEAVRRELLEETGLAADELEELVTFHNSAGWTDEQTTLFLAQGLRHPADKPHDFTPRRRRRTWRWSSMPLAEAVALAERGAITDAKTLLGAPARRPQDVLLGYLSS